MKDFPPWKACFLSVSTAIRLRPAYVMKMNSSKRNLLVHYPANG